MNKVKINSGLASVIILTSLFAGWQTLLLVVLFILLFCELNDTIKGMIVKVVSFYAALALFSMVWNLITDLVPLAINSFNDLIAIIESYMDDAIDLTSVHQYLFTPITKLVGIADGIVGYLITFIKFVFIISVLANKVMKENFIVKFVNKYVDKIVDFVNGIELGKVDVNNPKAASAPVRPQPITSSNVGGNSIGTIPEVPKAEEEVKPTEPKPEVVEPSLDPKPAVVEPEPKLEPTPALTPTPEVTPVAPTPYPPLDTGDNNNN